MAGPELTGRQAVVALLDRFHLRPDKKLGQNFLVDPDALERVVRAADLLPDSVVLEVGAGLGTLTGRLAELAGRIVAVEYDRRLEPILRETVGDNPRVRLCIDDILSLDLVNLMGGAVYSVVSNIPYQITSHLIRRLLESPAQPYRMVLTVQREIAERIVARPGDMSLLALGVQAYGQPRITAHLEPRAFYPVPKVASAVLRVDLHDPPRLTPDASRLIFRLARAGFSQPRKKLRNSLSAGLRVSPQEAESCLEASGISPAARAEALGLEDWVRLSRIWPFEGASRPDARSEGV